MENPIKMDDLGVPLFSETPMCVLWKQLLRWFQKAINCASTDAGEAPEMHMLPRSAGYDQKAGEQPSNPSPEGQNGC